MERASGGRGLTSASSVEPDSLASRSCRLEDVSFGAALDAGRRPRVSWAAPDGLELVGWGDAVRITADGADRFRTLADRAGDAFGALSHRGDASARPRAFGGVSFHDDRDDRDDRKSAWAGFAAAEFVIPTVQLARSEDGSWLTVVADERSVDETLERWRSRLDEAPAMRSAGSPPGIVSRTRTTEGATWKRQVERALARIETGDLRKVVLAQALTVDLAESIDVAATLERLRRRYPHCYRFAIDGAAGSTFFGASPERLVAKRGAAIETEALAGSVPRGETPEADDSHADRLRESEKLDREHELVVDAIRSQLEPLSTSIRVDDRTVRRLATIQHLRTPIAADLDRERHVLEIVDALHPTPAVGGVPQRAACEAIRSLESFDRGRYAAPVGWFDANGDGEFAVGIRSGVADDRRVTLFAGNGIVADSDPDEEWREVELKFRPILDELR